MPASFNPKIGILPKVQQEIWPHLAPATGLSLVLYGGTAVALYLGHRVSVDFDFFSSAPLQKKTSKRLLATKLEAILDRAEAKDYRDIPAMLSAGMSLEKALGAFAKMYGKDPGLPLRALGYFKDNDLPSLSKSDREILQAARDSVSKIPDVPIAYGSLAGR